MSKQKILIIRNAAPYDFGGAERMPVFIARELERYNFEVTILTRSKKLLAFAHEQNVKTIRTWWWARQNWDSWRVLLFPIYLAWQVILFIYYTFLFARLRPSVVSPQSKDDYIAVTLAARILGITVSWTDNGDLKFIWMNHEVWYKNPVGKLVYFTAHGAHSIIAPSNNEIRLVAANIPSSPILKKFTLIYNGLVDQPPNLKTKKSIDFISTARLVADKGIRELIEAFKQLVAEHPSATLAIVGDGPERDIFKKQAKNIPGITFYGHQTNPLNFLDKSKIFVLPTYHEAFGVAVAEACMKSLPVIATDIGGIPEIIDNQKNGLLVPVKDTPSLYRAMNELYNDSSRQKSFGQAGRKKFLTHFELSILVKDFYVPHYKKGRT
ncbi:hypothetical protein BGO17_04245 [Candidatus Saccharibacteria bacterium 49-20]|nr:MAG: hypothetical protein BGO17_04245 [Candidatus Saccharibacteria bacterium 49-20]